MLRSVSTDAWQPALYEKFRQERRQPFLDLMGLVRIKPGMRVVDLGCGTGEPTRDLHRHLRAAETLGLDSSEAMLDRCRDFAEPGLRFEKGDVTTWDSEPGQWDLVFSNAALHWVDGHVALFERLTRVLAPGGQIAVQVPVSFDDAAHRAAADIAALEPYRSALSGYVPSWPMLSPDGYANLLDLLGYVEQNVRIQVYPHRLESRDDVFEWLRGTLLTDYETRLPPELFPAFVDAFRARVRASRPDTRPHFFPYKRLLLWAQR
jgi:trans-aconitate 2-methyltransferase